MAAPSPATANGEHPQKVVVCKYVGTPGESRLQTGNNPIEVSVNTLKHHGFEGTFPFAWTDAQGHHGGSIAIGYVGDVASVIESCPGYEPGDLIATASLTVVDPSCANGNTASFTVTGEHASILWAKVNGHQVDVTMGQSVTVEPGDSVAVKVHADQHFKFTNGEDENKNLTLTDEIGPVQVGCNLVTPAAPTFVEPTCTTNPAVQTPTSALVTYLVTGDKVAGGTVTVTATAVAPAELAEGAVHVWTHTFITPTGCTAVSPPTTTVKPPKTKAETTTASPTVVEAGLPGSTSDTGTEAGLALTLAGLALLAGAAGVVLVEGGERK